MHLMLFVLVNVVTQTQTNVELAWLMIEMLVLHSVTLHLCDSLALNFTQKYHTVQCAPLQDIGVVDM